MNKRTVLKGHKYKLPKERVLYIVLTEKWELLLDYKQPNGGGERGLVLPHTNDTAYCSNTKYTMSMGKIVRSKLKVYLFELLWSQILGADFEILGEIVQKL